MRGHLQRLCKVNRNVLDPINRIQMPLLKNAGLHLENLIKLDLHDEDLREDDVCGDR